MCLVEGTNYINQSLSDLKEL